MRRFGVLTIQFLCVLSVAICLSTSIFRFDDLLKSKLPMLKWSRILFSTGAGQTDGTSGTRVITRVDGLRDGRRSLTEGDEYHCDIRTNNNSVIAPRERRRSDLGLKPFILIGPEDSGTNLLSHLIEYNFGRYVEVNKFRNGDGLTSLLVCKHVWANASNFQEFVKTRLASFGLHTEDVVVFMTIRSPISQITSWNKAPYELRKCKNMTPCEAHVGLKFPCHGRQRWLKKWRKAWVQFQSIVDVYNMWLKFALDVQKFSCFKSANIFGYEDMVMNPEKVVLSIARTFDLPAPPNITIPEQPAKRHGRPLNRTAALQKLLARSYLKSLPRQTLRDYCKALDLSLLSEIYEGNFHEESARIPYSLDCRSVV